MNNRLKRLYMILQVIICISALLCSNLPAQEVIVSGGPENDYEACIQLLNDASVLVIFDRNPDWASGDLYAAFSYHYGSDWTYPVPIIADAGDQATLSFVQAPDDTIRLFYASNQGGTYNIYYAWSMDGFNWTKTGPVDLGWGSLVMHYDPTVVLEPDNSLTMSYVVSGSGVYIAHCPYGGSWDTDRTQVSSSGYRPRIMKNSNGTYLYAYHKRTGTAYEYDVFVTTSTDRITWTSEVRLTTNRNSHDPFACEMYDGSYMVYYAKYTGTAYNIYRRRSVDAIEWELEEMITDSTRNCTQPHLYVQGPYLFTIWAFAVDYANDDHDVYFYPDYYEEPYLCGDANHDETVNVSDAVYIVNFVFMGGNPPEPYYSGNANCDLTVNVSDAVWIINYVFSGGNVPCDC